MGDPVARPVALNREDVALFQEMARWFRRHRRSMVRESSEWNLDNHAPEVYIALVPVGGIPAASGELSTGTGTGTGTEFGQGNSPSWAVCEIYRVVYNGQTPNLIAQGFTRRVHNLSFQAIPGATWVQTDRDKWGTWLATKVWTTTSESNNTIIVQLEGGVPSIETFIHELESDHFVLTQPTGGKAFQAIKFQMTITADASGLKLINDASTPGATKYYGTNGAGTKGWYSLPSGSSIIVSEVSGFTGTFGETRFDDADGFVLSDAGGGVVRIDLPFIDTNTINFTQSSTGVTAVVRYQASVSEENIGGNTALCLLNDVEDPNPLEFYCVDESGGGASKGWRTLWRAPPAGSSAAGVAGQIAYDNSYFYVCYEDNSWGRIALETGY